MNNNDRPTSNTNGHGVKSSAKTHHSLLAQAGVNDAINRRHGVVIACAMGLIWTINLGGRQNTAFSVFQNHRIGFHNPTTPQFASIILAACRSFYPVNFYILPFHGAKANDDVTLSANLSKRPHRVNGIKAFLYSLTFHC